MSRHRIAVLALSAALGGMAVSAGAYEIKTDPHDPIDNAYVGEYGEMVLFRKEYRVYASMHDGVEVVDFYATSIRFKKRWGNGFFPDRVKIDSGTFQIDDLVQMIVLPKEKSGFKTLAELRAAKELELKNGGEAFRINDHPEPVEYLPPQSFEVKIGTALVQLYTESPKERFILTARPPERGSNFELEYGQIRDSLGEYLYRLTAPSPPTPAEEGAQANARWLRLWIPFQACVLALALVAYWPRFHPRTFWSACAVFLFGNLASLIGWLIAELLIRAIPWFYYWFTPASVGVLLAAPAAAYGLERVSGRRLTTTGKVLAAAYLALALIPAWEFTGHIPASALSIVPTIAFKWAGLIALPLAFLWTACSREKGA